MIIDDAGNGEIRKLDLASLVNKEFLTGPYSSEFAAHGPYIYRFRNREKRYLHCRLPQPALIDLLDGQTIKFLPASQYLCSAPEGFRPKWGDVEDSEDESEDEDQEPPAVETEAAPTEAAPTEAAPPIAASAATTTAARAVSGPDETDFLLPPDSSQYRLRRAPESDASTRQQLAWLTDSVKITNAMLHRMWGALASMRPYGCICRSSDVAASTRPRGVDAGVATDPTAPENSAESSSSGERRRAEKRPRRSHDAGPSGDQPDV